MLGLARFAALCQLLGAVVGGVGFRIFFLWKRWNLLRGDRLHYDRPLLPHSPHAPC